MKQSTLRVRTIRWKERATEADKGEADLVLYMMNATVLAFCGFSSWRIQWPAAQQRT